MVGVYNILTDVDKPDIEYMKNKAEMLMSKGIRLGEVKKLYEEIIGIQTEIGDKIKYDYGIKNPNSGKQVIKYMQDLNNIEVYEVCFIDGKWTSNKDALGELKSMGYEFATDILDYRKAKKYAESINSMLEAVDEDGMVRPTVSLGKTNRINYSNPALMNIPKKLLWYIVVPRKEGNQLFSVDIKNQEPSILINALNIESLKDALINADGLYETLFKKIFVQETKVTVYVTKDEEIRIVGAKEMSESEVVPPVYYTPIRPSVDSIYYNNKKVKLIEVCNTVTNIGIEPLLPEEVAIETVDGEVFNVPVVWDDIKAKDLKKTGLIDVTGKIESLEVRCEGVHRMEFKQAWNAMTYGASSFGVDKLCKHIDGKKVYDFFNSIPEFKEYKSKCRKLARNGVQRINTVFGTELYANEIQTNRLQRVLMDLPMQGTGSDILSLLIKHFDSEVEKRGLVGRLEVYYTRNDEFIIEADKDWLKEVGEEGVIKILRDILEHKIDDWISFKVEVGAIDAKPLNIREMDEENTFY